MRELSVNQFRTNIRTIIDKLTCEHEPIRIQRRVGDDFIVISAEDWEREQETIYVLQNSTLMQQIAESLKTYNNQSGYRPTERELDAINRI
ncbi:MAG: type II toxin-antitoxin system Phd/YefM family antitoxin [Candidatus Hatepunaea meridiana]|nr:type II toxin-antitoxin system Phd/YefM family antitoxin [Candidatus Hatepunaea meridiana]